jgi:hypothetical protein
MAQITLDAKTLKKILGIVDGKLHKGIDWANEQEGKVTLTVPEPYDHSVGTKPVDDRACPTVLDRCGELGVLTGVFDAIGKRRK